MRRALIIEPAGNLRGSERALLDLLKGHLTLTVAVCCPPGRPFNAQLERIGVPVMPYFVGDLHKKPKWQRVRAAFGILYACLRFKPDVIYLNQSGIYKVALLAAALLDLPIVVHVRLFEDLAYMARQKPDPRRLRSMIVVSTAVLQKARLFQELEAVSLHKIYDAYELHAERALSSPARAPRRVACVGRLEPDKGQDILFAALKLLQGESVECLIIGDGDVDFVGQLKRSAAQAGTCSSIKWLGQVGDVLPVLRTCGVLVCPSHRETLGRVILEAWDSGAVPVVFSGSGGAAEIVSTAEGGIVYEQQEPQCLAKALHEAVNLDPSRMEKLINNGRAWVKENCNPKTTGRAVSDALLGALPHAVVRQNL